MPRKPKPKPDDPAQSKRFIETAREIGADADAEAFDRAFKKVVPDKPRSPTPSDRRSRHNGKQSSA
jgi:hypothetical protein